MAQLISVLLAIFFIFIIIYSDKNGSKDFLSELTNNEEKVEQVSSVDYEKSRIITFDIYKIRGDLQNIARRSFREAIKESFSDSLKYRLSYNPNVKLVVNIDEKINKLKKSKTKKDGRRYYRVKKGVTITIEYALFKNSRKTYFIDKIVYKAELKAGSFVGFDDALHKIDKKLYWIVAKKVANRLLDNYYAIVDRVR